MPSVSVDMSAATMTLVTEKLNAKVKPSAILVNNVDGAAAARLSFNDVFTPAVSNGIPIPAPVTVRRLDINIAAGECVSTEDCIEDCEFIGTIQVVRAAGVDANCHVSFIYNFN